jgi:hypothetical protein
LTPPLEIESVSQGELNRHESVAAGAVACKFAANRLARLDISRSARFDAGVGPRKRQPELEVSLGICFKLGAATAGSAAR